MVRAFEQCGLGGRGVTWEMLEEMDLIKSVKQGKIKVSGKENVFVSKGAFEKWCENLADVYDENVPDQLYGAQDLV